MLHTGFCSASYSVGLNKCSVEGVVFGLDDGDIVLEAALSKAEASTLGCGSGSLQRGGKHRSVCCIGNDDNS